jgi:DNA-binding NtrC family response regulator
VADGATLFLDEIAELSIDLQAKLLRVLQEGEFERLGCTKTIKVDVRVVTATNRNLSEEIKKGRFREDLYYRLNVFQIPIPPLRERLEDIPLLVWAFINEFGEKMGKKINRVSKQDMAALQSYHWPGNVRELRNVIEYAVIVSQGETLQLRQPESNGHQKNGILTLAEAEARQIRRALLQTGYRIKGEGGAAKLLGVNPSTLYSRMQKLGISNRNDKDEMSH